MFDHILGNEIFDQMFENRIHMDFWVQHWTRQMGQAQKSILDLKIFFSLGFVEKNYNFHYVKYLWIPSHILWMNLNLNIIDHILRFRKLVRSIIFHVSFKEM